MKNPNQQQGAAIIIALFLTALVAAMSIAMIERLRIDTRRTELLLNSNKANLYLEGSISWAMDQLNHNWAARQPNQIVDKMPLKLNSSEKEVATLTTIEDAQGLFNLNNLTEKNYQLDFVKLIRILAPNIEQNAAENIMQSTVDWISQGVKGSVFDKFYVEQNPPYLAAHHLMTSVSELRLVKGMNAKLFNQLSPYLTALPTTTTTNINSVSIPVLMSMSDSMTSESAKIIKLSSPFSNTEQLKQINTLKNNPIDTNKITVTSQYFLVKSEITVNKQRTLFYTLLQRTFENDKPKTMIIWQSKGTL